MMDTPVLSATISIDPRKSRIRIHKTLLQLLGFPKYIQFLVNPNNKSFAIKSVEKAIPGLPCEKIKPQEFMISDSYELYSKSLVASLCRVYGKLNLKYTYHLTGEIVESQKMVVFLPETLTPIECKEGEK